MEAKNDLFKFALSTVWMPYLGPIRKTSLIMNSLYKISRTGWQNDRELYKTIQSVWNRVPAKFNLEQNPKAAKVLMIIPQEFFIFEIFCKKPKSFEIVLQWLETSGVEEISSLSIEVPDSQKEKDIFDLLLAKGIFDELQLCANFFPRYPAKFYV
jgi:hypothetical protein